MDKSARQSAPARAVDKLSTQNVDNFCRFAICMRNVDNLSTSLVDKYHRGRKTGNSDLSTSLVDKSGENCVHVDPVHGCSSLK